jgi:DNA-binding CsgD family transcriptional regulator
VKGLATQANFDALVEDAYAAAFDESLWLAFLNRFAEALGGNNTALIVNGGPASGHSAVTCVRTDPDYLRLYNEHYCHVNPWMRLGAHHLESGVVGVGEMHISTGELIRTEFYNEWLRPQGLIHSIAALIGTAASGVVLCSTLRTAAAGPFTRKDIQFFQALLPHLRGALRTRERLHPLSSIVACAPGILDELPQACILVNRDSRPLFVNQAAQRFLSMTSAMRLTRAGLVAVRDRDTAALRTAVQSASGPRPSSREVAIYRQNGQPLLILVSPIPNACDSAAGGATAAVWISDPEDNLLSRTKRLGRIFGLTAAESSLAADMARGMTLVEIAESRRVSLHTVRNQLKNIFAKTGSRSQAHLVRLILTCPDIFHDEQLGDTRSASRSAR